MAEIEKHSLDAPNEEAIEKMRRLLKELEREEQEKNQNKNKD